MGGKPRFLEKDILIKKNSAHTTRYNFGKVHLFSSGASNLFRIAENYYKNLSQFFARLLVSLLARQLCFYLACASLIGLIVNLAIDKAILKLGKVAVGLSKWFL